MAVRIGAYERMQEMGMADPFDCLFSAEYATVVAIAHRVLADAHEAEDVAQEVFVQFHRSFTATPNAIDLSSARPWLHAAAVHTALNVVRGRRRRARREQADAHAQARIYAAGSDDDPARVAEQREQRDEVRAALARLPAKSAAVLALRYSGLSYAETAAALGVTIGQVGTLLRRAEAALRKEMTRATPR